MNRSTVDFGLCAVGLTREFGDGATADEICARSIRALAAAGVRHFYISNLPPARAASTLARILERVEQR